MGHMGQLVQEWIDETFCCKVDYAAEFLESLEKEYPKIHAKVMDILVNAGTEEVTDEQSARADDLMEAERYGKDK